MEFPSNWAIPDELDGRLFFKKICSYLKSPSASKLVYNWTVSFNKKNLETDLDILEVAEDLIQRGCVFPFARSDDESLELLNRRTTRVSQDQLVEWGRDLNLYVKFINELPVQNLLRSRLYGPEEPILDLHKSFQWIFGDNSEVMDRASKNLSDIRRKLLEKKRSIDRLADELIRDQKFQPMLQEPVHLEHLGRKVLLWKTDFSGHVDGMRHGRSKSGQSTYFEPAILMHANNQLMQLLEAESNEVRKITTDLLMKMLALSDEISKVIQSMRWLDFCQAKVRYLNDLEYSCRPQLEANHFEILEMIHPALEEPVAQNFCLNNPSRIVILSGPNAGGKTVCMKTVGIVVLHAALGLRVPARKCHLPKLSKVLVNLGDQQSLGDSLSSFSARLKQWRRIFRKMDSESLILVDEIMNATDPREGQVLAREICEFLQKKQVYAVITTHFGELKLLAQKNIAFQNASMVFDEKTLQPTFQLIMGSPGNSYALELASRLNLPASIITKAKKNLGKSHFELTNILRKQKQKQLEWIQLIDDAKRLSTAMSELIENGRNVLGEFQKNRERILQKELREARQTIHKVISESSEKHQRIRDPENDSSRKSRQNRKSRDAKLAKYQQKLKEAQQQILSQQKQSNSFGIIREGDTVKVIGYTGRAVVESVYPSKAEVIVRLGSIMLQVGLEDIELLASNQDSKTFNKSSVLELGKNSLPSTCIDLRGVTSDEALDLLAHFLDQGLMHDLSRLEIITGKGVLKRMVLDYLHEHQRTVWKELWSLHVQTGSLVLSINRNL